MGCAKAGVRFERAYCQYPLCNPSRTSLLNGRYPTTTGVVDNTSWFGALHPEYVSLPKYFKANGYAALRTGKIFHGGIDDTDAWTEGGEKRTFEGGQRTPPVRPPSGSATPTASSSSKGDGESHGDYKAADRAIDYLKQATRTSRSSSPAASPSRTARRRRRSGSSTCTTRPQVPLPADFAPSRRCRRVSRRAR